MVKYFSNTNKLLLSSDSENYVNVKTNKKITNLENKKFVYYKIEDDYICGEECEIEKFLDNNKDIIGNRKVQKQSPKKKASTKKSKKVEENSSSDESSCVHHPVINLKVPEYCHTDSPVKSRKHVKPNNENNVKENIDFSIEKLKKFDFDGVNTKIKVQNVEKNGNILFIATFAFSNFPIEKLNCKSQETTFSMKLSVRLYGIEENEKDDIESNTYYEILKRYLKKLDNSVYATFHGNLENTSIEIFSDKAKKNSINKILLSMKINEFEKDFFIKKNETKEEEEEEFEIRMYNSDLVNKYEIDKDV